MELRVDFSQGNPTTLPVWITTASKGRTPREKSRIRLRSKSSSPGLEREGRTSDSECQEKRLPSGSKSVTRFAEQRGTCPQTKNPRAVLPLDDAEEIWKPGVSIKTSRATDPLEPTPETSTKPRGQALNPAELVSILYNDAARKIPSQNRKIETAGSFGLSPQQVLGNKQGVRGTLREPPHQVGIPLGAERNVDPHAPAIFHEALLEVAADSM